VRREANEQLASLEEDRQEAELARHDLINEHKDLEHRRLEAEHAGESARQRRQMTERAGAEAQRQIEVDAERLADAEKRLAELESDASDLEARSADLSGLLDEAEDLLSTASTHRADVLADLTDQQNALNEARSAAIEIDRERTGLLAAAEADRRRAAGLGEQLVKLEGKADQLETERSRHARLADDLRDAIDQRRRDIENCQSDLRGLEETIDSLSEDRRQLAAEVADIEQQHIRRDGRHTALRELIESRAGLADAVRSVLDSRDSGEGFEGVIAPLADLIETDGDHALAVEAAIGSLLQALVVESVTTIPSGEDLARLGGRVTFLPLSGLEDWAETPAASPAEEAMIATRRVARLRDLVRAREGNGRMTSLLDRLLARCYLVPDLDTAMLLAAGPMAGFPGGRRFVTPGGRAMHADGRVTAGPMVTTEEGETGGLLQRRAEMETLEREIASLGEILEIRRAELRSADEEAADLNAHRASFQGELAEHQRQLVGERTELDRAESDLDRLRREREGTGQELGQLRELLGTVERDRAELGARAEKLQRLHDEQVETARSLDERIAGVRAEAESATERMTAARVEAGRLAEQLAAARRERGRVDLEREEAHRQRRNLAQHLEQAQARRVTHAEAVEEADRQIREAEEQERDLGVRAQRAAGQLAEADARSAKLAETVGAARDHAAHLERDWHSLEIARRELEVKRENLEQRTGEEIGVDLDAEYADYRAMMADGDVARIDTEATAAEIDELRTEIRKLGNVNLDAIEEESQLAERNEDLIRQVTDLDDARKKLTELIAHLNIVCRERFGEVFGAIQENFAGRDGMFRRLFGGGRAEVRLMPLIKEIDGEKVQTDEVDLLESGIEVIAKPPGKEPRSISQLSGGEKTLTSVALLMAIFESKPSCFCVLDEVDAALDDANVERFCRVLRDFTDLSHFIVITHNKRTMMTTDRLFGVTMQERGVSKRVSVRFEDVGEGGSISKRAARRSEDRASEPADPPAGKGKLRSALAAMRSESESSIGS
jgi:chromosome segregation protein